MILCDTGPIIAASIQSEDAHHSCVEMFTALRLAGRSILLPATVTAEVGYLLQELAGPKYEAVFLRAVSDGDFELVDLRAEDYARMAELVEQYEDLPLGSTDASVIALAERLKVGEVATTDRRHFTIVRPHHTRALTLLPERL